MTESLAWLRAPEAEYALGDLLCGLIRDIRRILGQPELGSCLLYTSPSPRDS